MKLAQLNIASARYPLDAPEIHEFTDNLERINGLAEQSPGFVWRLKDESGDATHIRLFDDPDLLVNMSVWDNLPSLTDFMYRTAHRDFMRKRRERFHSLSEHTHVLWWIADNHRPTLEEAAERLQYLRDHQATPFAFTLKNSFTAADIPG